MSEAGVYRFQGTAYEVGFEVVVPPALRQAAKQCVPHGTSFGPADACKTFNVVQTGSGFTTLAGEDATGAFTGSAAALEQLQRDLMIHVAELAPSYVFVHAGVVAVGGNGLMMPGTSFAGKTTLVAELVRAGATYYSDEYAVIDEEGWVHPYSRDLQMREAGRPEQRGVHVTALAGVAGEERLRISHVLFAQFSPEGRWSPEPVSGGMAVLEMLRHSIPVQRTPGRVMAALSKVMEGATAWRSERGDAREIVGRLIEAVGAGAELGETQPR
jgi:serine kinase of HPr protein (carbohydrate metabolism regulator)